MKIGILTMNYAQNYGGVLQVYGFSQFLKSIGHTIYIIKYRNSGRNSIGSIVSKFERRLTGRNNLAKKVTPKKKLTEKYLQNFEDFKSNYLNYTTSVDEYTIADICSELDVIIVGSDQIWNDVYSNKLIYYLDYSFYRKKIAYAACTILPKAPISRKNKIKKSLRAFDAITVRDMNTANYVESLGLNRPTLVVDPSCLHDYMEFIGDNPIGRPYILTYILSDEIAGGSTKAIQFIKEEIGNLIVVSVCIPSVSIAAKSFSDILLEEATPVEWVNLFYHASFVYTDSFHGIMFSMKYNKPFIAYMKDGQRRSRLQDLIARYELKNIVTHANQIPEVINQSIIDYSVVNPKLESAKIDSISILTKSIND